MAEDIFGVRGLFEPTQDPRYPRQLWSPDLSKERNDGFLPLERLLGHAHQEVARFQACIALVDFAFSRTEPYWRAMSDHDLYPLRQALKPTISIIEKWPITAAHDAAAAIFQFEKVLSAIESWIDKASAQITDRLLNHGAASEARNAFTGAFPNWKGTRNAAAHRTEISLKPGGHRIQEELSDGMIIAPAGVGILIQDGFNGRTYTTTHEGQLLTLDMTAENYHRLLHVYDVFLDGFSIRTDLLATAR